MIKTKNWRCKHRLKWEDNKVHIKLLDLILEYKWKQFQIKIKFVWKNH